MSYDPEFMTRLLVGNLGYVLLVISMMMTRLLLLRTFALASGVVGGAYMGWWLNDPVGMVWEATFAAACAFQIALTAYRNRTAQFSDDERTLAAELMPDTEPRHLRALLRVGSWRNAEPGTELIRQGQIASHLIFLKAGHAAVLVDGTPVGTCRSGNLIGEIGFARAEPANATVVSDTRVRYFALERKKLRRIMNSHPEIASLISRCNQREVEKKLNRMNEAMLQALATAGPRLEFCEVIPRSRRLVPQAACEPRPVPFPISEPGRVAVH